MKLTSNYLGDQKHLHVKGEAKVLWQVIIFDLNVKGLDRSHGSA